MTDDFLGKAVHGDITHYTSERQEQHDPQELINLLDVVVEHPAVEYITWHQYTPYFNDGDPCTFSAGDINVKLTGVDEGGDYDDGVFSSWDLSYEEDLEVEDLEGLKASLKNLANAWPLHEVICQQKFGDPSIVTYNGQSFDVEFYDHD